jgi:hypothetical protein
MHYKTIVLEFLQEQFPTLHEQLRSTRTLLSTVELQAAALKRYHEDWMDRLAQTRPDSDPIQIASQALELAMEDLRDDLSCASKADEDGPSLDRAMAYLRRHTPTA